MTHMQRIAKHVLVPALLLLALLAVACHKTPAPESIPPAGTRTIVLNDITVLAIDDSPHTFLAAVFKDIDNYPDRKAMMPEGKFKALTRTYLVKTANRTVLIDSGMGKETGVDGRTPEHLRANGVAPQDVTDILLTHMDIDHISGLIHQGNAVYPNARLKLARAEHDAWIIRGADREAEYINLARQVIAAYAGRIDLFEYDDAVLPGIVAWDARGHTAGHTSYSLVSGDKSLTIVGDMLHISPIQLRHTDYCTVYDVSPAMAAATRHRILARLSMKDTLIAGMHFPEIGKVRRSPSGGYTILPE